MSAEPEDRIWTTNNLILGAFGALILLLLSAGFWSINNRIDQGDINITTKLTDIATQIAKSNERLNKACEDIVRIDTVQKARVEKEREERLRNIK